MQRKPLPKTPGVIACLFALCMSSAIAQPVSPIRSDPPSQTATRTGIAGRTNGSVKLTGGQSLGFTAEAGILAVGTTNSDNAPIGSAPSGADGAAVARMSYVAYVVPGRAPAHRPIMFLWDGGPGASSGGLLVTSFGPVRVAVPQPGEAPPEFLPSVVDNPDSLLDAADLVFVDAPGTGFGRIDGPDAAGQFYGIDGDAAAFAHFIEQFLVSHDRQASPVILFGHSYGTMRSPVVARLLASDGIPARGIVSVSQWLNNDDFIDAAPANPGTDNAYIDALPTYAAIAWYHHRLHDRPASLNPFLDRVEAFALHNYATALLAGSTLEATQQQAVAATLETFTGIPKAVWLRVNLRIDGATFRRRVLDDPERTVGRLDTRYVGLVKDPLASDAEDDPFGAATGPTVAAAVAHYERDVLGFGRTAPYSPDADVPDLRWDNYHSTDGKPWDSFFNVIPDLANVMIEQPGTRLLMMNGYYDLSTTFLGAIEDLRHLPIPRALQSNIDTALYEAGHEPYLEDDVRHAMHDRISEFIAH